MVQVIPINKIIKLALLTSPFFAISGTTPGFLVEDFSLSKIVGGFIMVFAVNAIIWSINVSLLYAGTKIRFLQKTGFRFIISSVTTCLMIFFFFYFIKPNVPPTDFEMPKTASTQLRQIIILPITQALSFNVIIFVLIELLLLRELKNKISIENELLKTSNLEARINSLKEQLHPHFLFNSLSTLRSLINRSPEKATEYLEQLSDLLRFSSTNQKAVIALKDELALVSNYLSMQQVRFGKALNFEINIPYEILEQANVPVYSLQQLAENAIKHNILTKEMPLLIEIFYNAETNEITTSNNLQPKKLSEPTSSTGLANLNERYLLLGYPSINIQKSETKFSVGIQLIKNESSNYRR